MAEEEVMRKRLAVEGDGGGDDRRVMSLLKTFVRWCNSKGLSDEESEATYQKMLFTLGQCEFSFAKTALVMEMNKKEMDRYDTIYRDIEANIQSAKKEITKYKEDLQQARVIRRHRQEYDALAMVIQQHPPRDESQQKISELEQKLKKLSEKRNQLQLKLELRRKQFHLLVQCIHQLGDELQQQDDIEQDEESNTTEMDTS